MCICFNTVALFLLSFVLFFYYVVFLVGWKHDSVENAVFHCQPGELFCDLNLTLLLDHLRVGRKRKKEECDKFTVGGYSECPSGKCVYTPKWVECSDRRELESLNVCWMTMNWQYSAPYMLTCFHF